MIWLIGGTSDAKELATLLLNKGYELVLSVVSQQGLDLYSSLKCKKVLGAMDERQMRFFIAQNKIKTIVDASHPFAANVSENALRAAKQRSIDYIRYERPQTEHPVAIYANSYEEVVARLLGTTGNILLTTGSRMLARFADIPSSRLWIRVMPTTESIQACEALKVPMKQILAFNGNVSPDFNLQLIREFDIRYIVSKDSGQSGGLPAKVEAAARAGIPIFIIRRPKIDYPNLCSDFWGVLELLPLS